MHVATTSSGGEQGLPINAEASDAWTEAVSKWSFAAGVGIFILNMVVAWWVVASGKGFISDPLAAAKESLAAFGTMNVNTPANQLAFYERMVEMDAHLKAMANQQTVVVIGMASSFSLLAVGFSLLIMGIRSAFKFSGQAGPNHQLVLSSASPGLLCFLLGSIVMLFALSRPITFQLGAFHLEGSDGVETITEPSQKSSSVTSQQLRNQLNQATK